MNDKWNGEARGITDVMVSRIKTWHRERNLIEGSTDKDQVLKLMQELDELFGVAIVFKGLLVF